MVWIGYGVKEIHYAGILYLQHYTVFMLKIYCVFYKGISKLVVRTLSPADLGSYTNDNTVTVMYCNMQYP